MAPDASTSPVDWLRPIEAASVTGEIIPARWRWRDDADDELGVRFVTTAAFGWPFRDNGEPREPFDGTVWRIRNVQPTTPERDPALWDRMEALVRRMVDGINGSTTFPSLSSMGDYIEARAILADLPKPVDPDEQYAAELIRAQGWHGEGSIGEAAVLSMIAKAHRDGRQLAIPEVSHVG